jgi:hypothetical protein
MHTGFTVTDKICTTAWVAECTRLHTELELQFGVSMSTLNTTVKNFESK